MTFIRLWSSHVVEGSTIQYRAQGYSFNCGQASHSTIVNMADDKPHPALNDPDAYVLYRFYPSQIAAIIFVVLFGLTTLLHVFQLVKKRTWYFIPLVVGGACE